MSKIMKSKVFWILFAKTILTQKKKINNKKKLKYKFINKRLYQKEKNIIIKKYNSLNNDKFFKN